MYQKLIHDYLAGELSAEEQNTLFAGLAENTQWQEELNVQLQMQQTMMKDLKSVAVPAAATAAIFTSLGFAPPTNTTSSSTSHSAGRGGRFSMSTLTTSVRIAASLVSLGALAIVAYQLTAPVSTRSLRVVVPTAVATDSTRVIDQQLPIPQATSSFPSQASPSTPPPAAMNPPVHREGLPYATLPNPSEPSLAAGIPATPNEPIKAYLDLSKFASVDYLTQSRIIGVAEAGKIFLSEDGGHSWIPQESTTKNDLFGVNFIDTTHGVVVGAKGTMLITSNAGRTWAAVNSPTASDLITVRFATRDTVYACGAHGTVLRSVSGGAAWETQASGVDRSLFRINVESGLRGVIRGERGIAISTTDGGRTWQVGELPSAR